MDGMNRGTLIGNLVADPELRQTGGGPVLNFRLATSESWIDQKSKERQTRTEYHAVAVWGGLATALHKFLIKGALVFVEGPLRTRMYEKDGVKHYPTSIHAVMVRVLSGGARGGGEGEYTADDAGGGGAQQGGGGYG